jgi:hypothetical protein
MAPRAPAGAAPPLAPPPLPPAKAPPAKKEGKKEEKKADDEKDGTKKENARPAAKLGGVAVVVVAQPPGAGGLPVIPGAGGPRVLVPVPPGQITLLPGKVASSAVDTSSAVRVRAADKRHYRLSDEEIALVLQISVEPRLRWQNVLTVSIDSAIDDNDQKLSQAAPQARAGGRPGGIIVNLPGGGANVWINGASGGVTDSATVRLKKGEKESKALKELTGTIGALVRGQAEPILVADNVMKSAGKSFKGKQSGEFKILSVDKKDDGSIQIAFEFEIPAGVIAETMLPPAAPRNPPAAPAPAKGAALPPIAGIGIGAPANAPRFFLNGLILRDEKENVLNASVKINWDKMAGFVAGSRRMEYIATYRPEDKDAAQPAKLVFIGRREITISVPFTLKGIELK